MMSEGNGLFSRDALLGPAKRRFATVEIADLGKVRIRSLTEGERSRIEASMCGKDGKPSLSKMLDLKCRFIVDCVVDADGNQLFSNSDISSIRQQDSRITNALVEAIEAHCGWSERNLESIEKN